MVLITGATGFLGAAVMETLLEKLDVAELAVYARDEQKAKRWQDVGVSVRIGDFNNVDALDAAFHGVTKLLLIPTNDETAFEQHKKVIDAAIKAKVKHLYYAGGSVNHNVEKSELQFLKGAYFLTENFIRESGITYTIFQNGLYADIIPDFIGEELPLKGINFPSGEGKASFALREEMAEAIAKLMLKDNDINASYTLTGNQAYSFNDIAKILTDLSGTAINFYSPDNESFVEQLRTYGVGENEIMFASLFGELIKNEEYSIVDSTLEQLLGRKPTSLKDYLEGTYFPQP